MQPNTSSHPHSDSSGVRLVFTLFVRAALTLLSVFFILFFFRVLTAPTRASASSNTIYPASCLGGWQAAGLASGETTLPANAPLSDYADTNSAVLDSSIAAQLFCGGFAPEARTNAPHAARVSFQWAFVTQSAGESATSTDASMSGTTVIDSPGSTSSVNLIIPALTESPADATSTDTPVSPTIPGLEIITPSAPLEVPAPTIDTPVPTPPADAPQSFIYKSTLGLITSTAHADPSPAGELVRISYSTDGTTWTYGGSATRDNWQNFDFSIPNPTWDDLKNLQIKVEPVTTIDTRPTIYLDSIALHIDDSPTLSETLGDKLAVAGDLLNGALDGVNALADAAAAALTNATDTPPTEDVPLQPTPQSQTAAAATPPAPLPKVRILTFTLAGNSIPSKEETPWQDKDIRDKISDTATNIAPPTVSVTDSGRGLLVSGSCTDTYATVLAFRHADDYLKDPRAFVVNVAVPCYQNHFSYNLVEMPPANTDGDYYLIVGKQGATGSWVPVSAVLPFTIKGVEVVPNN